MLGYCLKVRLFLYNLPEGKVDIEFFIDMTRH